jgi:hypothetical protein
MITTATQAIPSQLQNHLGNRPASQTTSEKVTDIRQLWRNICKVKLRNSGKNATVFTLCVRFLTCSLRYTESISTLK